MQRHMGDTLSYQLRLSLLLLLAIGIIVPALGDCGPLARKTNWDRQRALYIAGLAKWRSAALHSYNYTVKTECFCPPPVTDPKRVVIVEDQIVSATDTVTDKPIDTAEFVLQTPDTLFTLIGDELALAPTRKSSSSGSETAYDDILLDVTYDSVYGYPTRYVHDVALICDAGYTVLLTNLEPL